VLVVEDDEAIRAMIAAVLTDEAYEVRTADDGAAGIEALRGWRPDAIVLDVVMPGADAAVFRALQVGLRDAADVPVVLVSATRAAELDQIARDLGAAAALPKPLRIDELLGTLAGLTH
jgi:DNA-binding response OmpR family regulator